MKYKFGSFILILILAVSLVQAVPGGANVTGGVSSGVSGTTSTTTDIESGNVTYVDIYSQQVTGKWAGFYGNVSGAIILGDSANNMFYSWTVSNFDGAVVYAVNDTISNWGSSNIVSANNSVVPTHIVGSYADNFTVTFNDTEDFNSSSINKADIPFAKTWQNNTQGNLRTYALYGLSENANIWAGLVDDDSTSFRGVGFTVDYQILVPTEALTTYNFYLELP